MTILQRRPRRKRWPAGYGSRFRLAPRSSALCCSSVQVRLEFQSQHDNEDYKTKRFAEFAIVASFDDFESSSFCYQTRERASEVFMTIASQQSRSSRYNKLKKRALEIFARHGGWLSPRQWAVQVGFYPVRAAYSYLLRLHRFGLLERGSTGRSIVYQLSVRGKRRLDWLKEGSQT